MGLGALHGVSACVERLVRFVCMCGILVVCNKCFKWLQVMVSTVCKVAKSSNFQHFVFHGYFFLSEKADWRCYVLCAALFRIFFRQARSRSRRASSFRFRRAANCFCVTTVMWCDLALFGRVLLQAVAAVSLAVLCLSRS